MLGSQIVFLPLAIGLVRTVVSISHCGCDDPGSIPGLDTFGPVYTDISDYVSDLQTFGELVRIPRVDLTFLAADMMIIQLGASISMILIHKV